MNCVLGRYFAAVLCAAGASRPIRNNNDYTATLGVAAENETGALGAPAENH